MGVDSKIEWTDHTWNPWMGCTKVSEGCRHCYMFRDMARFGKDPNTVAKSKTTFELPLKQKNHEWVIRDGSKVFTCSWSDWFHSDAHLWRPDAWEIIRQRPEVIFQIVTKRTDQIDGHLPQGWPHEFPNVWLIATAENQQALQKRWPQLVETNGSVLGLSIEPLLDEIDFSFLHGKERKPDWIIVGGESGPQARFMRLQWVRKIRRYCQDNEVPFFFKQWGEFVPASQLPAGHSLKPVVTHNDPDLHLVKVGRINPGRFLDGREWSEFPTPRTVS